MAEDSKWKRKVTPTTTSESAQKAFDVEGALKEGYTQEQIDAYLKYRNWCAMQAGDAKSDFAAKKMYETCLDRYRVSK